MKKVFLLITAAICSIAAIARQVPAFPATDVGTIDNVIYVAPLSTPSNTQLQLSLKMKNTAEIRGFQFDLYLPEGITAAKTNTGKIVASLAANRLPQDDAHTLTVSEQPDGALRFLCGSQYDETFTGNDGEIITLTVNVGDITGGEYILTLKDVKLSETNIANFYLTETVQATITVTSGTPGDANADGVVSIADVTAIINHINGVVADNFSEAAADVNGDGIISIADVTRVINIINQ